MQKWIVMVAVALHAGCGQADPEMDNQKANKNEDETDSNAIEQPLRSCPYRSYLCGNDGLDGPSNNLYLCNASGETPILQEVCVYGCQIVSRADDKCNPPPSNATPIMISIEEMNVLSAGNYDSLGRLKWANSADGSLKGGSSFASPRKTQVTVGGTVFTRVNAAGDATGQCVSMIKSLSGRTTATTNWIKGASVTANCATIPIGTAVATFFGPDNRYQGHTGFLASCSDSQITLWDENFAKPEDGLIRKHTIKKTSANNVSDAGAYYVVTASE